MIKLDTIKTRLEKKAHNKHCVPVEPLPHLRLHQGTKQECEVGNCMKLTEENARFRTKNVQKKPNLSKNKLSK